MKKIYTFALAGFLVLGFQFTAITNSFTPPAARTGAPGEVSCNASGCHTGPLNAGGGSVTLVNPPATYVPGNTYTLQVRVTDVTKTRFGFQVTALDSRNSMQGNFIITNTVTTRTQTQAGRQYINHLSASALNNFVFDWTAPATNVGPITFYLAGNAANNNNSTSGDNVYNASFVMQPAIATGILDAAFNPTLSVYPNPATDKLIISGSAFTETTAFQITDLTGKVVRQSTKLAGTDLLETSVAELSAGVYVLSFETNEGKLVTKKFVVE